jgi:hypothetical protein
MESPVLNEILYGHFGYHCILKMEISNFQMTTWKSMLLPDDDEPERRFRQVPGWFVIGVSQMLWKKADKAYFKLWSRHLSEGTE